MFITLSKEGVKKEMLTRARLERRPRAIALLCITAHHYKTGRCYIAAHLHGVPSVYTHVHRLNRRTYRVCEG